MSKPTCARGCRQANGRFYPSAHGSQGPGWGGPAKGWGNGAATAQRPAAEQFSSPEARAAAQAARAERRARLESVLEDLAEHADRDEVRLAAAARLHDLDSAG